MEKLYFTVPFSPVQLVKTFWAKLRCRLLGLQAVETSYIRRGFRGATADVRSRLEQIGAAFLGGYHAALEHDAPADLAASLNSAEPDLRGFAFEGAAMGLALLDFLTPWRRNRLREFLRGAGEAHAYMTLVGAGWAWARLPVNVPRAGLRLEPLLGWLALDGWGFHEGFFHWPKYIAGQPPPGKLNGFERRVFDQGFGRSFWFVNGAKHRTDRADDLQFFRRPAARFVERHRPGGDLRGNRQRRLRWANCAKRPARFSRSSPKARPSPPRPGSGRET